MKKILSIICLSACVNVYAVAVIPAPTAAPIPSKQLTSKIPASTALTQEINCNYHFPATLAKIDPAIVTSWAKKAATQSFDFDYSNLNGKLTNLKRCYTEQGWQGFHTAFLKSGNEKAIRAHQFSVTSQVNGRVHITQIHPNQWKVSLPLHVVYQNASQRLIQAMTVDLLIGRKITGDLGIMQIIATPHATTNMAPVVHP